MSELEVLLASIQASIAALERRRTGMVEYAKLKLNAEDWHAAQDAGSDPREIDAIIEVLRAYLVLGKAKQ